MLFIHFFSTMETEVEKDQVTSPKDPVFKRYTPWVLLVGYDVKYRLFLFQQEFSIYIHVFIGSFVYFFNKHALGIYCVLDTRDAKRA